MLAKFHEARAQVGSAIADVGTIARAIGATSVADRIAKELVKKLEEDRFHLVVVGEFNHGKTTFVNALLGSPVLPTGVTPTTATIHHVTYAASPVASVVKTSGAREDLAFDRVKSFAVGGDASAEDVDFLEIGYPSPLLAERIVLVDTPGVNDLSLQRADVTYSYIPRADAVLFLLDAGQILKESERVFLEEKLIKGSRDKIVFVVTKWDLLDAKEQAEALAYAKTQLAKLVREPVVLAVSAETGFGMDALLSHLTTLLATERGRILLDNALGEGIGAAALLAKGVMARRRGIAMSGEELERRIAALGQDLAGQAGTIEERRVAIREEIRGLKVGAKKDLERFVDDVIRQLPHAIESAKGEDLKTYLPAFLEDTFRRWAEDEAREIAKSLEALAERTVALVREDAIDSARRVAETLGGPDVKRLDVQVDTFSYDVGVVALFTVGLGVMFANVLLGGLLTVAAPILALVLRGRIEAEYRKKALEAAPGVLRAVGDKVGPKIDEMIDEFAKKLDTWVVSAGEELHREVLEVLSATKHARAESAASEGEAFAEIDAHGAGLEKANAHLAALRADLWKSGTPA